MERTWVECRDPEFAVKRSNLRARLAERPGRPLVLALGSSRVAGGVNPEALSQECGAAVFNFGIMGFGPVGQFATLRRVFKEGVRPRGVILEFWPPLWLLGRPGAEVSTIDVSRLGWEDLEVLCRYQGANDHRRLDWLAARSGSCYAQRCLLVYHFAPAWVPTAHLPEFARWNIGPWGWMAMPGPSNPAQFRAASEKARAYSASLAQQFHVASEADRALREAVSFCHQEGIAVCLLYLAECSASRSWYPARVRAEVDDYLKRMERECGVRVIDARDWADDGDLHEGFHLLPEGATKFTRRLEREVLPGLVPSRQRAAYGPRFEANG